ncbi:hypothetical protein BV22DRAFT_1052670 [Leucogyrophana mollusca]|uniref:Uncharacterized protein n=1 Tax=Leucogyrophana mollusca TaxID=85980 RepID=A0ACB8AV74_9AGAM|nr:hypothetical protein BV22DRAFT_1052670 [Leucogyrophana mollusca]
MFSLPNTFEHWLNVRYSLNHCLTSRPNPPPYVAEANTPVLHTWEAFPGDITETLPDYKDTRPWTRYEESAPYLVFNQQTVLFDGNQNPGYYHLLHTFIAQLHTVIAVQRQLIEYKVLPQQYYDFNQFLSGEYLTSHDHQDSYLQVRVWQREHIQHLGTYTACFNYDTFAPYALGDPLDVDSIFPDQEGTSTEPWPAYYIFIRLIAEYGDIGSYLDPYSFTEDSDGEIGHLTKNFQYVPAQHRQVIEEFVPGRITYDSNFADTEDNGLSHSSDQEFKLFAQNSCLPDGSYPDWVVFPSRYDSIF